jgi:uncharacterized membrane protein
VKLEAILKSDVLRLSCVWHQNLLIVLADARLIPYNGGFEFYAFNHMMFVIIGLFYAM